MKQSIFLKLVWLFSPYFSFFGSGSSLKKALISTKGEVYKILYIHVPVFFSFPLFIYTLHSQFSFTLEKDVKAMPHAKATAEIGLFLPFLHL